MRRVCAPLHDLYAAYRGGLTSGKLRVYTLYQSFPGKGMSRLALWISYGMSKAGLKSEFAPFPEHPGACLI